MTVKWQEHWARGWETWGLIWAYHFNCLNIHFCSYKIIISRILSTTYTTSDFRWKKNSLIQVPLGSADNFLHIQTVGFVLR